MDVEVKNEHSNGQLKDQEVRDLIKRSQQGDQAARDLLIQKTCGSFGQLCSDF